MIRFVVVLLLAGIAGWQLTQAGLVQAKAVVGQWLLERAWQRGLAEGRPAPPWPGAVSHPVARLGMPRLEIDLLVLDGADTAVLAWGPGMEEGRRGHRMLAAHRDTHFRFLKDVMPGDRFEFHAPGADPEQWVVRKIDIVDSRRTDIDLDHDGALMTLVTCYPFNAPTAGGPMRLVASLAPASRVPDVPEAALP